MEWRNPANVNIYIQGSIWIWVQRTSNKTELKQGVQSSGRPVMIISNDVFNQHSPSVNCLTITSELKHSPVHVPFILDVESHIQCEQIHTISKSELVEYKGVVAPITLSNVKSKLSIQFDMRTDRNLEILTSVKISVDELNNRAKNGFGFSEITADMAGVLENIHDCFSYIKTEISKLQINKNEDKGSGEQGIVINAKNSKTDNPSVINETKHDEKPIKPNGVKKRNHGKYTDEEIAYILDTANPIDDIIARLGLKNKTKVYQMRSYHNKKNRKLENSPSVQPTVKSTTKTKNETKRKRRVYSDEEKEYIIDKSNSLEDIMAMFDYKDKATAYKMRAYFKKNYPTAAKND